MLGMAKRKRAFKSTLTRCSASAEGSSENFSLCNVDYPKPANIDRISMLPDELLVSILSLLTLEKAAVVSLVSKRWRNLWFFIPISSFSIETMRELGCFKSLMNHSTLGARRLRNPFKFHSFKLLLSLSFRDIGVNLKVIHRVLPYCPRLQHLCVADSWELVNLKVAGIHLNLKHLEVYNCMELKYIGIHAPNLVSFRYQGPLAELSLECGHQLTDILYNINSLLCYRVSSAVRQFNPYLSQLKTFTLCCLPTEVKLRSEILPTFSNLTELDVFLGPGKGSDVLDRSTWSLLLKASPSLRKLGLHLCYRRQRKYSLLIRILEDSSWETSRPEYACHGMLKEVVLSGFRGFPKDMELSIYLLHVAVSLEKFTIDTYDRKLLESSCNRHEIEGNYGARKCAELLLPKKPPQVEILIL